MRWWFKIVKDHSSEVSMTCGRVVVQAENKGEASKKFLQISLAEGQHFGMLIHGPYDSQAEAETATAG